MHTVPDINCREDTKRKGAFDTMNVMQSNQKRERIHACIRLSLCAGIMVLAGILHRLQSPNAPQDHSNAAAVFAAIGRHAAEPFGEVVAVGKKQAEQWHPTQDGMDAEDKEEAFSSKKAETEGDMAYHAVGKE